MYNFGVLTLYLIQFIVLGNTHTVGKSLKQTRRRVLLPKKSQDFTCQTSTLSTDPSLTFVHVIRRNFNTHAIECVAASIESTECIWYKDEAACNNDHTTWNAAALNGYTISCSSIQPAETQLKSHWCYWRRKFLVPLAHAPKTIVNDIIGKESSAAARETMSPSSAFDPAEQVMPVNDAKTSKRGSKKLKNHDAKVNEHKSVYQRIKPLLLSQNQVNTSVYRYGTRYVLVRGSSYRRKNSKSHAARLIPSAAVANELGLWPVCAHIEIHEFVSQRIKCTLIHEFMITAALQRCRYEHFDLIILLPHFCFIAYFRCRSIATKYEAHF